ncbi:disulfide bond formation protein B [Oceanicoccus sagamiensis]|uniref:Disulfide bond formation protein B n=1 Tax=Oceanicoccus sagamiensis TaxID=716816 RepID=A0A1X9N996_9GAMM|nr:disulfide bond formation protein B [Oceanicoccus sagamiensis]ARN73654.1 disulfide bond formation protein B [Oceanicoccus sagamiensis]
MILPTIRQTNSLMVLGVIGMMAYALYTEYYLFLEPCPLCMTQRFFYVLIALFALIAVFHQAKYKLYGALALVSAIGGMATASRQVWLQHLPPEQVPACGPSLEYMLETFPLGETLMTMIRGDGNCAEVVWTFVGFSMGEWSLICFTGYAAVFIWQLLRRS